MKHISVDLEGMGRGANVPIIQIGAVEFSTGNLRDETEPMLGREFKVNIDLQSALDAGGVVDGDTFYWWLAQSAEARWSVSNQQIMFSLATGLMKFSEFVYECKAKYVWGNGATYDCKSLSEAYDLFPELERPWEHRDDSCLRNLVMIARRLGHEVPREVPIMDHPEFVKHDALWDAKRQAQMIVYGHRLLAKGLVE